MRIRDVVDVPYIDKIVRLTDNMSADADRGKLENLLKGYVITDSVETNLNNFFYKVTNFTDKGQGFIISGLPGCGKSHFMTVLGSLVKDNKNFELMSGKSKTIDKAKEFFKDKKIFVVPLMAEEGGPEISLQDMFFDAAEKLTGFPFTDESYYIKQFEEAIIGNINYSKKIDEFVSEYTEGIYLTWADFKSKMTDSRSITRLIKSFLDKENIGFFKPDRGRIERLNDLYSWLYEENYDGILVLIDELSEYLNDRGGNARTDALFLKTFVENSSQEINGKIIPAWIVGSFLSSLQDIKVPEVYDLMKDRFPTENQFTLKVDDVEEIIDQRLIIKKRVDKVEEAFVLLKNKYNAFKKVEKETFMKIYPLHPDTLDILSKSVRFLSRQRSIVDFVLSEVKGNLDEGGTTKGILDEDFTKLVTPDRILNHFQERIRELSDKREYFDTIYSYYMGPEGLGNGKVKDLFKDNESDQETASKLIDVMTLLKINELEKDYTVRDLTYMIQYPKMERDFAEEKINRILLRMYNDGRYIEVGEDNDDNNVGDNVYFINKDVSLSTRINQDMKRKLTAIEGENIVSIVEEVIKTLTQEPLNIGGMFGEPTSVKAAWNNINRNGVLQFNHLSKVGSKEYLTRVLNNLKDSENDFYLFIGTIFEYKKQKDYFDKTLKELNSGNKPQALTIWGNYEDEDNREIEKRLLKSIYYWLPSDELEKEKGKEKRERLKEYYAYIELLKEYKNDYDDTNSQESMELLEKVEEKILNLEEDTFNILKGLYLNGSFYNVDGKLDIDISAYGNESLNKIISVSIDKVLRQTYSSNKFIAPNENVGLTDNATNKFINNFILGNKTNPIGIEASIVRNIVKKFGDTKVGLDSFKFNIDVRNNNLVKFIINELDDVDEVIYKNLYNKVRKSEYGPDKGITEILIAMLIKKGFLIPIKNDTPISITNVKAPLNTSVTKFKMGEFVDEKYIEGLMKITKLLFNKKFEKQDLSFQEEIWEELIEFKKVKEEEISSSLNNFRDYTKGLMLEKEIFEKAYTIIDKITSILEDIDQNNGSKDGLEYFIESNYHAILDGDFEKTFLEFNKIVEWTNSDIPTEIRKVNVTVKGYMNYIPEREEYDYLLRQYEEIRELLTGGDHFIFENATNDLSNKFEVFKNDFISRYIEEHNNENSKIEFDELRQLLDNKEFKFLGKLSKIEKINMDYDYINISADINNQISLQCKESPLKFINNGESSCVCNFKLGQKKYVESKERFVEDINKAILGYIDELNNKANIEKIEKHINSLKQIGEKKDLILMVEKMYKIPLDEKRLERYMEYLMVNPEVIEFIDEALKVNINIIQRDINKLIQIFKDKTYSKTEMLEKFTYLIEENGEIKNNHYIKFTDFRNGN